MRMAFRQLFTVSVLILLTGCVSTQDISKPEKIQNFHIIDVSVSIRNGIKVTPSFHQRFRNVLLNYAGAYNQTQFGRISGYNLEVTVIELHYKDPLASLLVGDNNRMTVASKLVDPENGNVLAEYKNVYVDAASGLINGVSGMVISASIDKEKPEATMIKGVAHPIMRKVYSKKEIGVKLSTRLKNMDIYAPPTQPISPLSVPKQDEVAVPQG